MQDTYQPTSLSEACFVAHSLLDLKENMLYMFRLDISAAVQVCNSLQTLLHETVLGQPSGSLGEKERHGEEEEGESDLDDEWSLPGHLAW